MSFPQELVLKMCGNLNIQSAFKTVGLSDVWSELGLNNNEVQQKTQDIVKKIAAEMQSTLTEFVRSEQHTLLQFRVQKVRSEIAEWWLKCHFSVAQREEFQAYYSEDYSNELLQQHQVELKKLKMFHSDNEQIFEVVDELMKLHEKLVYLEAQDKNPNRLFENRGGQLLKDERDRKATRKELPRLEKKVAAMTADFSQKYGREFTIDGKSFADLRKSHADKLKENAEEIREQNTVELKLRVGLGSGMKRKLATGTASCVKLERKSSAISMPLVKRFKPLNMQ